MYDGGGERGAVPSGVRGGSGHIPDSGLMVIEGLEKMEMLKPHHAIIISSTIILWGAKLAVDPERMYRKSYLICNDYNERL